MDNQTRATVKGDKTLAPIAGSRHAFTPWDNNTESRVEDSPLTGMEFIFEPNLPKVFKTDHNTIVAPGMTVRVKNVFHTWNGVLGLDMYYVYILETGHHTHVTPRQLGLTLN